MKITQKILEVMKQIPTESELPKLNEVLIGQELVSRSEFEVIHQSERVDKHGVVRLVITVSCRLIIIDTESDDFTVNVALGMGISSGDMAVIKAQEAAREMAWKSALGIRGVDVQSVGRAPEIVVETPEEKLIAEVRALYRWDLALFDNYFMKRFKKPIEQLNIVELSQIKTEFEKA